MTKIRTFRDLKIWELGMELVEEVYLLTKTFPREEMYGLRSQLRRSAISIPSNISEGFLRKSKKEYKHFLDISLGSCGELETQIEIAFRLNYLHENKMKTINGKVESLKKMIFTLQRCL